MVFLMQLVYCYTLYAKDRISEVFYLVHTIPLFPGSMPYDGMIEDDIKTFVKEGNILEKLGSCPINV